MAAAVSKACSPLPPAIPPVRKSVIIGRGPKTARASGLTSQAITIPARVSAIVCVTQPAIVTGLEAPSWPKQLTITGMPKRTASTITLSAIGSNRNGGTTWLTFSDRNGLSRNAVSDPAI